MEIDIRGLANILAQGRATARQYAIVPSEICDRNNLWQGRPVFHYLLICSKD